MANVPLYKIGPFPLRYTCVRLKRRERGAVTQTNRILGLLVKLLHDLQVCAKFYLSVNFLVPLRPWEVIVHGLIFLTLCSARVTPWVTRLVFTTLIPKCLTSRYPPLGKHITKTLRLRNPHPISTEPKSDCNITLHLTTIIIGPLLLFIPPKMVILVGTLALLVPLLN